jgi:peptide deformylase
MSIRDVIQYPDPFLRQPTRPVERFDEELRAWIQEMADIMYDEPGVGLAANQVGIDRSVLVYDVNPRSEERNYRALINPEIVEREGSQLSENEGCLSVPGFRSDVKRYATVHVKALDLEGREIDIHAEGFESVVLQHEIDHLNGVLFIDRISPLKRELYKRRRRKELRTQAETVN